MITFASFIAPGLDLDLLPYWVRHYSSFKFDRYSVVLHERDRYDEGAVADASKILKAAGWEFNVATGNFGNGALQRKHLDRIKGSLGPEDHLVVADSDEFQDMPPDYRDIVTLHPAVTGCLIDRWDATAHAAHNPPFAAYPSVTVEYTLAALLAQYPREGDLYAEAAARLGVPPYVLGPARCPMKVLAHKVRYNVVLDGAHFVPGVENDGEIVKGRNVYHFTWREGIVKRFADRIHLSPLWTLIIAEYFGMSRRDPDLFLVLDRIRNNIMQSRPAFA